MKNYLPWKIIHLDLSQAVPSLSADPNYQGVYLVLWLRSLPLGQLELPAHQLPMPASWLFTLALQTITPIVAAQLETHEQSEWFQKIDTSTTTIPSLAAGKPLAQLSQYFSQPVESYNQTTNETISVIICTRDRPEQLARCLRSLQHLAYSPHEIIVVDNAPSSDATQQLVAQLPQIRYVQQPRPGLSAARNAGINYATGSLIAFTDDDVEVHPDWLWRLQSGFRHPDVMAVTGFIIPAQLETEAEHIFQTGAIGFGCGYTPRLFDAAFFQSLRSQGVPVWQIGAGANMAFRRQIFSQVGGFDERLGAGASGCSEDSEFWYRILAEGWCCYYEPTAVVYHYHRADFQSLQRQMYAYMRGHVAALLIQAEKYQHWGNLRRAFISLPLYYAGQLTLAGLNRFQRHHRTTLAEIQGCITGFLFYLNHRSSPPTSTQADGSTFTLNFDSHQTHSS
jgi:GT2 family glycosyltransferase